MTDEELNAAGCNTSLVHIDFMSGTKNALVIGLDKNGKKLTIMEDGHFVI